MSSATGFIGARGEEMAVRYLEKKNYRILKRNFSVSGSEVDIIALKGDLLCFVEVKTRRSADHGSPLEFVDRRKIRRIIRAARIFSSRPRHRDRRVRFDIIAVLTDGDRYRIDHLEEAFAEDFY